MKQPDSWRERRGSVVEAQRQAMSDCSPQVPSTSPRRRMARRRLEVRTVNDAGVPGRRRRNLRARLASGELGRRSSTRRSDSGRRTQRPGRRRRRWRDEAQLEPAVSGRRPRVGSVTGSPAPVAADRRPPARRHHRRLLDGCTVDDDAPGPPGPPGCQADAPHPIRASSLDGRVAAARRRRRARSSQRCSRESAWPPPSGWRAVDAGSERGRRRTAGRSCP